MTEALMFRAGQMALLAFLLFIVMATPSAQAQPTGMMERAFFYNDIYHFVGKPYRTPSFGDMGAIAQPFIMRCSNLNRLVLPLYLGERKGMLMFKLYSGGREGEPVFSTEIDLEKLPAPYQIGTHDLEGVLYNVWIPPQANSKNTPYVWEVTGDQPGVGLFLTRAANPQLQAVSIGTAVQEGVYSAFYAYCAFEFNWRSVVTTTWERLLREKLFLFVFLIFQGGLIAGIMGRRK